MMTNQETVDKVSVSIKNGMPKKQTLVSSVVFSVTDKWVVGGRTEKSPANRMQTACTQQLSGLAGLPPIASTATSGKNLKSGAA